MFLPILCFILGFSTITYGSLPVSGKKVTVQFEDKTSHVYPIEYLNLFVTTENMFKDIGSEGTIPLYNIPNKAIFDPLIESRFILEEHKNKDDAILQELFKPHIPSPIPPDTFQQLLMGANYLDGGKRFLRLLFNGFKNTEPSLQEMPFELSFNAAGKLMEDLLQDPEIKGVHISQHIHNIFRIGQTSSPDTITCHQILTQKSYYQNYHITESQLIYGNAIENMYEHSWELHRFGISPDNQYFYILQDMYNPRSSKCFFKLYDIPTKKIKNYTLNLTAYITDTITVSYNKNTRQFLLFFPSTDIDVCIFAFCSFDSDEPIMYRTDNRSIIKIKSLTWQFIDDFIIAATPEANFIYEVASNLILPLTYDNKREHYTYVHNEQKKTAPKFIVLNTQIPKNPHLAYPASFMPNYQTILNNKIADAKIKLNTALKNSDSMVFDTFFDPYNLRYLATDKQNVYISDLFPLNVMAALQIMNQKWIGSENQKALYYTNILYDAWYVYHAAKQTDLFLSLQEGSPILKKVSPELRKIYPLLTPAQKAPLVKERAKKADEKAQAFADVPGALQSQWKPVQLLKSLRQNLASFYTQNKKLIEGIFIFGMIPLAALISYQAHRLPQYSFSPKDWSFKRYR